MTLRIRLIHMARQALGIRTVQLLIHPFVYVPMVAIRWRQRTQRQRTLAQAEIDLTSSAQLDAFFARFTVVDTNVPLIRIGGVGDGGYIVPDDLEGISACFSPGISTMVDFELAMAERGIRSYMADASVKHPPTSHELFDFEPLFLGDVTAQNWTTLGDWVATKHPDDGDLLLQIDIEGGEWPVLRETSPSLLERFRIVVIEIHDMHDVFDKAKFPIIDSAMSKLLANFVIVHIHPNNIQSDIEVSGYRIPPVIEMTLLRRDRVTTMTPVTQLPRELDRKNNPHISDIPLAPYWFK